MTTLNLEMNRRAWDLVDRAADRAGELGIGVDSLSGGTRIVDAGVSAAGGLAAGLLLADVCMGGLGHLAITHLAMDGELWPGLQVWTDHPTLACMASQYAGWAITVDKFFAMGSGPLRAKALVEKELFRKLDYMEDVERGVLVLEGATRPDESVAQWIAAKSRLPLDAITLVVAPTASLAGGVQIVARVLEIGLHKMDALGFDVNRVVSGTGTAPLPPTAKSDVRAIGRTNDCVMYGGQARYVVRAEDDELADLAGRVPAEAASDYGTPFYDIFKRYNYDFYKIDPMLFSPAEVWLTSATTGRTFHGGRTNPDVLRKSFAQ